MATSTTSNQVQDVARCVLEAIGNDRIEVAVPGTSYRLTLTPDGQLDALASHVGKRIKGRISGRALRLFKANGGGRFIEPVWGEPRIVAGLVKAIDQSGRRVLVDVAVPMWLAIEKQQQIDLFAEGDLVNCYVESGLRFARVG